jgi:hypothetical protein
MVESNAPLPALILVVLQGKLFHGYHFIIIPSFPLTFTYIIHRLDPLYRSEKTNYQQR